MYRVSLEPKTIRKMKKGISNAMIEIRFRGVRKTLNHFQSHIFIILDQ